MQFLSRAPNGKRIPFRGLIPGRIFRSKQKAPARTEAGAKGTAYAVEVERVRSVSKDRPCSTLPAVTGAAVRGIHHGQIRAQLAVKRTVGILHGRRRRDRGDLTDALAAVCHGQ